MFFVDFLCRFGCGGGVRVGVTLEETVVLVGWKKRSDNHVLARMKAEAILYASRGVDVGIIAKMVERAERTVQEWPAEWQATRMCSVLTGHAGNQNAAKPTRVRKEELKAILAQPPSQTGVHAEFWDVPAIRDVVKILFRVPVGLFVPAAPALLRVEFRAARTRSTSTATSRPPPDARPRRRPRSKACWTRAGRCMRQTRSAWSTRPRAAARGPRKANAPNCP